jgi:hypothetical protein
MHCKSEREVCILNKQPNIRCASSFIDDVSANSKQRRFENLMRLHSDTLHRGLGRKSSQQEK